MNIVLLELNSYTQKARIFLNDQEVSQYSELKNYTYKQILEKPEVVLDAIGKELNDDFALLVTATPYITNKIAMASLKNDYCISCKPVDARVNLTTKERAERLAAAIKPISLTALLTNSPVVPDKTSYGPIEISFTADEDADADFQINFLTGSVVPPSGKGYVNVAVSDTNSINRDFILSICETYLLNPYIGSVVESIPEKPKEIAICNRLDPIISVLCPETMEVDTEQEIALQAYPEGSVLPSVTVTSNNRDCVGINGTKILAHNPGVAEIRVFLAGENTPIHSCVIQVGKIIRVEKIEFEGLDTIQREGQVVKFQTVVLPADAVDAEDIIFESSNPDRALVVNDQLIVKAPGDCTITAKTTNAIKMANITILPKLQKLSLPLKNVKLTAGAWTPVTVTFSPENAYNQEYSWSTSDKSVATVVKEEGREFIKAIGVGTCTLVCSSKDDNISDSCTVMVQSALNDQKPNFIKKLAPVAILLALIYLFYSLFIPKGKAEENPYDGIDATPVDVFQYVEFPIQGYNGSGSVGFEMSINDPFISACEFETETIDGLSNGDVVIVTVECPRTVAKKYGKIPQRDTKEIVVSGLNTLIKSEDQMDSQWVEDAKAYWASSIDEYNAAHPLHTMTPSEYCTSYLLVNEIKEETILYFVFEYDRYDSNGVLVETNYCPVVFYDLQKDADGNTTASPETGISNTSYASLEDLQETFKQHSSFTQTEFKG